MQRSGEQPAQSDKVEVVRPHRVVQPPRPQILRGLRRALGTGGLYAIGYGNVGSSIYYALGITAFYALGATPIALAIAGALFIFTAATYAEGAAMIPEAGGSSAFARRAFNDLVSFIAGWALILNYLVTTSISAITVVFYLGYFWDPFKTNNVISALGGMVVIFVLMMLNVIGVRETSRVNIVFCVIDLLTQALLIVVGMFTLFNLPRLLGYVDWGGSATWPTTPGLIYSVSIAMVAYFGLESVCQMAEETKEPGKTMPRALLLSVVTVLVMYAFIPLVALSAMTPEQLNTEWHEDPIAGIAHYLKPLQVERPTFSLFLSMRDFMRPWVAVLAATILLIAANAGLLAASRLSFSMAQHRQIPAIFGRVHRVFRTPHIAIISFAAIASVLLVPGFFGSYVLLKLGELYTFGAMLAFSLAHASIITLRVKEPDAERPWRAGLNVHIRGYRISVTAIIGLASTLTVFLVILWTRDFARWVGLGWIAVGIVTYYLYRRASGLDPIRVAPTRTMPQPKPTRMRIPREAVARAIESILVPVQDAEDAEVSIPIACRLARAYRAELHVLHVVIVPRSLPLDTALEEQLQEGESILTTAENIAEEKFDMTMRTHLLQARAAGAAIVELAADANADVILMATGRPYVAGERVFEETAEYVFKQASCQVWTMRLSPHR